MSKGLVIMIVGIILLFIGLISPAIISLNETISKEKNQCVKMCVKKGFDYFDVSQKPEGFSYVPMCECLDDNGEVVKYDI